MFVLLGVFGCVTSLGAMLLGMSDLTGISPRINLKIKFLFEENLQAHVQDGNCKRRNKKESKLFT